MLNFSKAYFDDHELVKRVDALMEACRALETEVKHSRTHAAHLLQAVLKEAFSFPMLGICQ